MWRTSIILSKQTRLQGCPARLLCSKPAAAASKQATPPEATPPEATPPETQNATQTPPPQVSGGGAGGVFAKLLGVSLLGLGGVVGYAWYDPKFRKQVEDNVPYSQQAFQAVFQEKNNQSQAVVRSASEKGLARPISVSPLADNKPAQAAALAVATVPALAADKAPVEIKKDISPEEQKKQREREQVQRKLQEKEAEEAAENLALEHILEQAIGDVVEASRKAIDAEKFAAKCTCSHSLQLKTAMDDTDPKADKELQWQSVTGAQEAKLDAATKAVSLTDSAQEALENLKLVIKEGKDNKLTKKNTVLIGAGETMQQCTYDLKKAVTEHEKAVKEEKLMKEYQNLVTKGKEQFKKELEAIMPDVQIKSRWGGKMTEDELNSLIAHAHRRIDQLQRQLAEQQALEKQRLTVAIDRQRIEDDKIAARQVEEERQRLLAGFEIEKEKLGTESGVQFERDLRQHLARQAAAHSDHLAQVLKVQQSELHERYETLLKERLSQERDHLREEIMASMLKLQAIEAAVDGRADMEKQGRKAQELWLACQTFVNVISNGNDTWDQRQQPLTGEIHAIKSAGNEHPFVNSLVESIPDPALTRGVFTEEALVERFLKVNQVCRRVGMINESGGTLYKYFVSYIQSFFLFRRNRNLTDNDQVDPLELDAFTLLDNAARYIEKGDLEMALRFMNQLQGEPRKVASDWIDETRLLLETRQAASALLGHASAAGLGALF